MVLLNKKFPSVIYEGHDPSGLGRQTYITIISKNNNKTSIYTLYRPCNSNIESVECSTVIKQQWLLLQEKKRDEHPYRVAVKDIIKTIKTFQDDRHEIIIVLDGNKYFTQAKGDIAFLCKQCQLYDPLYHLHGEIFEEKS